MPKPLRGFKLEHVKGYYWRGVPERFSSTSLESGPNFNRITRYSIPHFFSALYFSSSPELSKAELIDKVGSDGEPIELLKYQIDIDGIVDLRDPKSQDVFRVTREEITQHKSEFGAYTTTHQIAKILYDNHFPGLIAPSSYDPSNKEWSNLVIYPANLIRAFIKVEK